MTESKYVIMRDTFLINEATGCSEEDAYPIAVYDTFDDGQEAMLKLCGEEVDRCNDGEHEELGEFDVATAKHWCVINSKKSAYYISFRLFPVPYNAIEFEKESD